MDPIQRKTTPNVQGPQTPPPTTGTGAASKFNLTTNTSQPTTPQSIARPNFDALQTQIQDAVNRSLTRDQVRDEVIDKQAKDAFGSSASPAMTASISEAFKNDPHLSQLF